MTKIDIFSGFLGAGKTTLIKKLIGEVYAGQKIVLIENEFGEIGIDGGFLQEAGIEITEMNSGCICCSLVGDFGEALKKVMEEYHPDRILIEPSGVGKLSDVAQAVEKAETADMEIGCMVAVVDATKCKVYMKNFGEFYNNQIENAGTIILSGEEAMLYAQRQKSSSLANLFDMMLRIAELYQESSDSHKASQTLFTAKLILEALKEDAAYMFPKGNRAASTWERFSEEYYGAIQKQLAEIQA